MSPPPLHGPGKLTMPKGLWLLNLRLLPAMPAAAPHGLVTDHPFGSCCCVPATVILKSLSLPGRAGLLPHLGFA